MTDVDDQIKLIIVKADYTTLVYCNYTLTYRTLPYLTSIIIRRCCAHQGLLFSLKI